MRNVWKVGMTHSDPEFMIENNIAYAFGDSMLTYLTKRNIGQVKNDDIIILAKSIQQGIRKIGIAKGTPFFCLNNKIDIEGYKEQNIKESKDVDVIEKLKSLNHSDVVYFEVQWLPIETKEIEVTFINQYGFTSVKDTTSINLIIEKYFNMEKYFNLLEKNKNIILTGAPGTGKTYLAKELAKKLILPSNIKNEVVSKSIDSFLKKEIDSESIKKVEDSWSYWKNIIKENDFNLDDFANTQANIKDTDKIKNGYYLMNFLEWKSSIYGSSKPGNAFNYGIKMNNDNKTYTIYDNKEEPVGREIAEAVFQEKIKPWIKQFLNSTLSDRIKMIESGNELIRAGQLLRKMIILDFPAEFLSIYQDETIKKAYDYFVGGNLNTYFEQNKAVYDFLLKQFKLEKNIENQLRLTGYIWTYFNKNAEVSNEIKEEEITEKYFIEHSEFVQFHPSYDYTDFVEGLRPIKKENSELGFELKNGIFKQLCKKAFDDKTKSNYVIIIDEINRAEISKVFGELFFSIDPGYRGTKGMVKTQYSNMQNEESCFISIDNHNFFVPENIYIIGTMNDIDRSVETFDFAMRRRFTWIEIKAIDRIQMLEDEIPKWKDIAIKKLQGINKVIESIEGLNSSYHIGPAYFLKLEKYEGDFSKLWHYHIEPLVREYLRGLPNAENDLKAIEEAYNNG